MLLHPESARERAVRPVLVVDGRRPDADAFNRPQSPRGIDRLEADGGLSIVSTRFGKGFAKAGRVKQATEARLRHLADKAGWFVLVSDLLDRLLAAGGGRSRGEAVRLELGFQATASGNAGRRLMNVGTVETVTSRRRT
jgi:hypothetical protein